MMVKICGITNREDALAAVDAGASALGFNFYRDSPRYVTPTKAAELGSHVAVTKVGIFVNEPAGTVARILDEAALDIAQVYGEVEYPGTRTWRVWRVGRAGESACPTFHAEAILIDGFSPDAYGGTGKTFDWSIARGLSQRIILAGGLDAENVAEAIEQAHPWGVDACSRIEKSPGIKDHEKMKRFIQAALACSL